MNRGETTITVRCTATYTRKTMYLHMPGAAAPFAVQQNQCRPDQPDDPGFPMLTNGPWYAQNPNYQQVGVRYGVNNAKRSDWFEPDRITFEDGNSTRKAIDDGLKEHFSFVRCGDDSCSKEIGQLGIESTILIAPPAATPVAVKDAV